MTKIQSQAECLKFRGKGAETQTQVGQSTEIQCEQQVSGNKSTLELVRAYGCKGYKCDEI